MRRFITAAIGLLGFCFYGWRRRSRKGSTQGAKVGLSKSVTHLVVAMLGLFVVVSPSEADAAMISPDRSVLALFSVFDVDATSSLLPGIFDETASKSTVDGTFSAAQNTTINPASFFGTGSATAELAGAGGAASSSFVVDFTLTEAYILDFTLFASYEANGIASSFDNNRAEFILIGPGGALFALMDTDPTAGGAIDLDESLMLMPGDYVFGVTGDLDLGGAPEGYMATSAFDFTATLTPKNSVIPEPSTFALVLFALTALGAYGWRRRRR